MYLAVWRPASGDRGCASFKGSRAQNVWGIAGMALGDRALWGIAGMPLMRAWARICVRVRGRARIHACIYACMRVYMCAYACMCAHTCACPA